MNVLIVHAHPEPESFSSSLARTAAETLREQGHDVVVSDLYRAGFDPVSSRKNFVTVKDAVYYKPQQEEMYATEQNGFAPELEAEIQKLEAADLLIFSFPLWWFGLPGILKGWVDRVFAMGRVYGGSSLYENGLGAKRGARAMVIMSTGGSAVAYSDQGVNPHLYEMLSPIQHGMFWFNGFQPLEPFVAWSASRVGDEVRAGYLESLKTRLRGIFEEPAIQLAPLKDFPQFGPDTKKRFQVVVSVTRPIDEAMLARVPEERAHLAEFKRTGFLLRAEFTPERAEPWRGFLTVRAASETEALERLQTLPLAADLKFEIYEIR